MYRFGAMTAGRDDDYYDKTPFQAKTQFYVESVGFEENNEENE